MSAPRILVVDDEEQIRRVVQQVLTGGGVQDKNEVLSITERLGAVRTLPKPFSPEDLLGTVEEVLPGK